jgi:hypothetical protein
MFFTHYKSLFYFSQSWTCHVVRLRHQHSMPQSHPAARVVPIQPEASHLSHPRRSPCLLHPKRAANPALTSVAPHLSGTPLPPPVLHLHPLRIEARCRLLACPPVFITPPTCASPIAPPTACSSSSQTESGIAPRCAHADSMISCCSGGFCMADSMCRVCRQGNQHAQGSVKRQRGSRRMAGGGLTVQAGAVAASRTRGRRPEHHRRGLA